MFRKSMVLMFVFFAGTVFAQENFRPYIAVHLAKAIMMGEGVLPDNDVKKLCDGSGWIAHGDGHRTRCPGCSACEKNGTQAKECSCGCGEVDCDCANGSCKKQEIAQEKPKEQSPILVVIVKQYQLPANNPTAPEPKVEQQTEPVVDPVLLEPEGSKTPEPSDIIVYHFGAEWCNPCRKMKSETWSNEDLKNFMKDRGIQINYFDYDTPEHRKYFSYYGIKSFPTVLFVDRNDLNNPKEILSGFTDSASMLSNLKEELNEQ